MPRKLHQNKSAFNSAQFKFMGLSKSRVPFELVAVAANEASCDGVRRLCWNTGAFPSECEVPPPEGWQDYLDAFMTLDDPVMPNGESTPLFLTSPNWCLRPGAEISQLGTD